MRAFAMRIEETKVQAHRVWTPATNEDDVPHEPKKLDPPNGPFGSARSFLPYHDSGLRRVQARSTEHASNSIFGVQLSISYTFANFRGRLYTIDPHCAL